MIAMEGYQPSKVTYKIHLFKFYKIKFTLYNKTTFYCLHWKKKVQWVRKLIYLLDCTTAWVCAEVPDAMLVNAQAASNCNEGLQKQ